VDGTALYRLDPLEPRSLLTRIHCAVPGMECYLDDKPREARRDLGEALAVARTAQMMFEGALAQHVLDAYVERDAIRQGSECSRASSSVVAHFGCSEPTSVAAV
jgi:hypothetical protein